MATAPDELIVYAVFAMLPPEPPFSPHVQGQPVLLIDFRLNQNIPPA